MPPKIAVHRRAKIEKIIGQGSPETFEGSRNGRHYRIAAHPVLDATQKTSRIAIFITDITEQRQMRGAEQLLHQMNRNLLSGMSLPEVLSAFCRELAELFDLQLAWVGRKKPDGMVEFCAGGGPAEAHLPDISNISMRWDDGVMRSQGPVCSAIRSGALCRMDVSAGAFLPWRAAA